MADITLAAAPILGGLDTEIAGCRLVERDDLALVSLAIPLRGRTAVQKALKKAFGLALPDARKSSEKNGFRAIQTAADQVVLIFPHPTPDAAAFVAERTARAGYTTDQTDVWLRLELSGPVARTALGRLCPLDLHDSAFPVGAAARTVMEHMGAILVRTGDARFLMLSASSSARSFCHALETSLRYIAPRAPEAT